MSLTIAGMGTANPEHVLTQEDALELAQQLCCQNNDQAKLLKVLYRRSGIRTRHTVVSTNMVREWVQGSGTLNPNTDGPQSHHDLPHSIPAPYVATGDRTKSSGEDHSAGTAVATRNSTAPSPRGATTRQRMELYMQEAPALAQRAAAEALARAEVRPDEVTHLVTVSCSGFAAPGVDIEMISRLGFRPTIERTHVGYMACHGSLNGLRVAKSYATADPNATVLMCAVELCSLHYFTRWDPTKFMSNIIFGDGAAAIVGRNKPAANEWRHVASGSCLIPNSSDALQHLVSDHGFEVVLSARVPDLIQEHLRPWLESWLMQHGLTVDQVQSWAIHPGGPRVLNAVEAALDLPNSATTVSREVLSEFGNMSSATVLFILERLRRADAPRPCVALAFGPGLMAEAALFV